MTNPTSGSDRPSGPSQTEMTQKPKRVNWIEIARDLQHQVAKLEGEVSNLKKENEGLQKGWLKPREQIRLEALDHFYRQVVNIQINGEPKKRLDKLCEEAVWLIKERDKSLP